MTNNVIFAGVVIGSLETKEFINYGNWHLIKSSNATASSNITDADGNTKVQTEESPDEGFDLAENEKITSSFTINFGQ